MDSQNSTKRQMFHNDSPEYNFGKILKISRMLKLFSTAECMEWLINCYLPIINSHCTKDSFSKPITLHSIVLKFLRLHHSKTQNSISNHQLNLLTNFKTKNVTTNSLSLENQKEQEEHIQTTTKDENTQKTRQARTKEKLYLTPNMTQSTDAGAHKYTTIPKTTPNSDVKNVISNFNNNDNNNLFYQIPESVISHNICPFLSLKEIVESFSNVCLLFSICCENGNVVKTLFINDSDDQLLHGQTNYDYSSLSVKRNDDDVDGCKMGYNTTHLYKCWKMEKLVINPDNNTFRLRSFWEKYIKSFCNLKYFKMNPNRQFSSSHRYTRYNINIFNYKKNSSIIMPREMKQQLYHLTGTITIGNRNTNAFGFGGFGSWNTSNMHEIISISNMMDFGGLNSNLRELNLNVILFIENHNFNPFPGMTTAMPNQQVTPVSTFHNFFYKQLLLSNILSNLRHFYMTVTTDNGGQPIVQIHNVNASQENQEAQELIKQVTAHLMFNFRSKQKEKEKSTDFFQIESFGCDIRMGGDFESKTSDTMMYLEKVCLLILNKFGWLMRSLHFKTQKMGIQRDKQFSGIVKHWQFLKNTKNENENNNNSEDQSSPAIPSNLQEICITDYKHKVYKKFVQSVLDTSNNIQKFSILQINKSQFEDVFHLLTNCCSLIMESINQQRLNQIVLNQISIQICNNDMSHRDRDLESLIQFFQKLCHGIKHNYNCQHNGICKPLIVKVHLIKGGQDDVRSRLGNLEMITKKTNKQAIVCVDKKNIMLNFIDDCFKIFSKMVQKMNQLLFIIQFDGKLIKTFSNNDFGTFALCKSIKETFEYKANLNETKFRSNIDLSFYNRDLDRYGFRMVFESNDYQHNGGFGGPKTRLYSCPNCDTDLE